MAPKFRLLMLAAATLLPNIAARAPRDAVTLACLGDASTCSSAPRESPSQGRAFVQLASIQRAAALAAEENANPSVEAAAAGTTELLLDPAVSDAGLAPNRTAEVAKQPAEAPSATYADATSGEDLREEGVSPPSPAAKFAAQVEAVANETFGEAALLHHGSSAKTAVLAKTVAGKQDGSVAAIVGDAVLAKTVAGKQDGSVAAIVGLIAIAVMLMIFGMAFMLLGGAMSEITRATNDGMHLQDQTFGQEQGGYGPGHRPFNERSEPMQAPPSKFHGHGGHAAYDRAPIKQGLMSPAILLSRASSDVSSVVSEPPTTMPHFCAELVVPKDFEAMLVVAAVRMNQHGSQKLEIRDQEGKTVVHAEVALHASGQDPVVRLASTAPSGGRQGQTTLASCYIVSGTRGRAVDIYNRAGQRFAVLERTTAGAQAQYKLTPVQAVGAYPSPYLLFRGSFQEHKVGVWDERQTVKVADTEITHMHFDEGGRFYKLRVSSDGDVGLVLCALLAIEVLESRS